MERRLIVAVSDAKVVRVEGVFQRHCSPDFDQLRGSPAGGRWGPSGAYSVLYLGRPTPSVIVEAYRHLIEDDLDGLMRPEMVGPRNLLTCEVAVNDILDLRDPASLQRVGLSHVALTSDVGDYDACQRVAQAAHQLDLRGVIAPSSSGLGETLALFEEKFEPAEYPTIISVARWDTLPADPRRLRIVEDQRGA